MKILLVLGTRPEIIKLSPIIRECERLGLDYSVLHTGQHYSYSMDKVFFENLELQDAKYKLDTGSGSHGEQTGKMLIGIEKALRQTGIPVTHIVTRGTDAAAEVLEQGEKTKADLVVMASRGRSKIARWIFGSVAQKILFEGDLPLLLVRKAP